MLWTDENFVTPEDLTSLDSEVPAIAKNEGIILTGENGFIRRQVDEAGDELLRRMQVFGGWIGSSTLSTNHLQAVLDIGSGASNNRTKILLNQIVVSDRVRNKWSNVKRWVVYRSMVGFYRNAFSRTATKDRYKSKLEDFQAVLIRCQNQSLNDFGLPICAQPLSRPAATFEIDPGTWGPANISKVSDIGSSFTGDVDVAVSYVDSSRYQTHRNNGNAESNVSEAATVTISNEFLTIDITSLNPPNGLQDPGTINQCVISPLTATHWNVYVGNVGESLYLQNTEPISIDVKTLVFVADPVFSGPIAGTGQYADRRYQFQHLLQRG